MSNGVVMSLPDSPRGGWGGSGGASFTFGLLSLHSFSFGASCCQNTRKRRRRLLKHEEVAVTALWSGWSLGQTVPLTMLVACAKYPTPVCFPWCNKRLYYIAVHGSQLWSVDSGVTCLRLTGNCDLSLWGHRRKIPPCMAGTRRHAQSLALELQSQFRLSFTGPTCWEKSKNKAHFRVLGIRKLAVCLYFHLHIQ